MKDNLGFYFGIFVTVVCFINFCIFCKYGIEKINKAIYDNIPTSEKIHDLIIEQNRKRLQSLKIGKKKHNNENYISNEPPRKKV